jgi:drug/metabolite transporter (DMT)-like permease
VQLISNVVFATAVLGEKLSWPVALGTVVITLGDVLMVGSGTHHRCARPSLYAPHRRRFSDDKVANPDFRF